MATRSCLRLKGMTGGRAEDNKGRWKLLWAQDEGRNFCCCHKSKQRELRNIVEVRLRMFHWCYTMVLILKEEITWSVINLTIISILNGFWLTKGTSINAIWGNFSLQLSHIDTVKGWLAKSSTWRCIMQCDILWIVALIRKMVINEVEQESHGSCMKFVTCVTTEAYHGYTRGKRNNFEQGYI